MKGPLSPRMKWSLRGFCSAATPGLLGIALVIVAECSERYPWFLGSSIDSLEALEGNNGDWSKVWNPESVCVPGVSAGFMQAQ